MGQSLTILKRNGQTRYLLDSYTQLCTVKSAEQKCALLGEDTVTLKLTSAKPLQFVVGDYMEVFGSVYTLNKFDEPTKNGEGDFEYSLIFEGLQYKLLAAQYRSADALGMNPTAEFSLVCDMRMAMGVLVNNMNRVAAPDKEVWELGECMDTEFKEYSFSRENCLSVLQRLCQDNKCEFEIQALGNRRYRLNIKQKVGSLFPAKFTFGRGGGIYQLRRRNINNDDVISRLYVEGGTQNITSKYRNGAQRLRLATNAESYVEDNTAIAAFGIKEGSRTYDDIFPCRTGHVSSIVSGDVLSFVDDEMFNLNEKDSEGNTKWLIDGTPAKVKFTGTSNLAGYTFDIQSYDHATHKFKLARYEDSRGFKYPSESSPAYQIEAGDEYVLLDIVMPQDPYEVDAEAKLLERAQADLAADCQPKVSYELDIEGMTLERAYGSEVGITNVFQLGDLLHVVDADINVDKAIRLTGFTRDCYSKPYKYKLTLSDTVEVSLIQSILEDIQDNEQDIIDLTNKTNVQLLRMQWRTTQELLGMVFDADGYFDTSHIRPSSIETMMLSVGNRNGQFIMRDVIVTCNALAGGKPNPQLFTIQSNGGILQHYAIEENIRTWQVISDTITLQSSGAMYLYAQCPKTGSTCRLILSQNRMATEVGTYYYFLVGVLSSIYNGYRELTTTYGNTRITGRCINCGRIESADKQTYFDLDNSEIGGNIKFRSTTGDLLNISELEQLLNDSTDLLKAIRDNYTEINGGLILSTFLKLGAVLSSDIYQESAGLKAMLASTNEVAAYFGGTYAEAQAGIKDCMTIIYHNGKLKAKDAEITGVINAKSGTIGSLAIVGNDLIGLDENGVECVRISIGSLPSVGSVFTTSSIMYSLSSTNASCSYPTLEHGFYTAYAERTGCEISTNRDDGNYTNNAHLTATVGFTLDKDATQVTFGRIAGGYSTNNCSNKNISPVVSGIANLYRVNGSSRTKVGSFPIEEQGDDHSFNSLVKGTYQLEISVDLEYSGEYWYGDVQLWIGGGILVTTSSTASGNGTNILANDGILSMRDGTHYMMFSFNNGFEARFGSSGFRVSNAGVQKLNSSGAWQAANI